MMAVDPRVLKTIQDETFTAANPLPTARAIAPDAASRAVKAHRATGVDDLLYAENLQQLNDLDDQDKWDRIVATSPRTARFLAEKQTHAAMGRDDAENLQKIEGDFNLALVGGWAAKGQIGGAPFQRSFGGAVSGRIGEVPYVAPAGEVLPATGPKAGVISALRGIGAAFTEGGIQTRAGIREQAADALAGTDIAGLVEQQNQVRSLFGMPSVKPGLSAVVAAQRESAQSRSRLAFATPEFESDLGRGLYSGLQSTAQQVPGLAATLITRIPAFGLASAGIQAEATAYSKYRARGATPSQALLGGGLEGGIEVATEMIPMGTLLASFGKGGKNAALGVVKSQLQEQFGEQVATALQDAVDTAIANPNKTWGEYLAERPSAAYQTALATLAQSGVMLGAHRAASSILAPYQQKAAEGESAAVFLESIDKLSQASKVRNLDTTTFENFVADVAAGSPAENLYIDGKVLNQSGIALELARFVPELADDIQVSIESGGTLRIPTATFAGRISGTEISQTILENARTDPIGFSKVEAQDFYANQAEIMRGEIERAANMQAATDEFAAGQRAVQDTIKSQLDAVGRFTPEANELYSLLIGSRVATRARQLGISPEQMFAESPLAVMGELSFMRDDGVLNQDDILLDPADANILNQSAVDKNLLAVHNLSAENLAFADKIGGLAVPSIGVISKEAGGVKGFGEITLIGKPQIADPSREQVFSSDAYTARFPAPSYPKVKSKAALKVIDSIRKEAKEFDDSYLVDGTYDSMVEKPNPQDIIGRWIRSPAAMAKFLREKGETVEPILRGRVFSTFLTEQELADIRPLYDAANKVSNELNSVDAYASDEHVALRDKVAELLTAKSEAKRNPSAAKEGIERVSGNALNLLYSDYMTLKDSPPVDRLKTQEELESRIDKAEFKKWVDDKILSVFDEPFLQSGRKKVPYKLGNIVDAMTDTDARGKEKTMTYGPGQVRAASSVKFRDVEQMREAAKTAIVNPDEYESAKDETEKLLSNFRESVAEYTTIRDWRGNPDVWEAMDGSMRALAKWATSGKRDVSNLQKQLVKEAFRNVPVAVLEKGVDAGNALLNAPVPYFEAKPQRAVGLDEFSSAVVPSDASAETKAILENAGINIVEYDKEDPQGRENAVREAASRDSAYFQEGGISKRGAFIPDQNIIALLEKADLSTFLHEAAHWFYETDIAMASKFVQQETRTAGEQEIVDDVSTLLSWHGIIGTPQQQLDQWHAMSFEEQRSMHERTAETFEAYLYTGKAPTIELQKAFNTFRQWLLNVYRSLKDFLASRNREMTDEVRGVFDRMLATQEQIDMANAARSMVDLIETADQVGMSQDEFAAYQALGAQATAEAASELESRSLRDMKFQANARSKEIKKLKAEQKELRDEITMQVRGEVMSMPIYRAWSFLTGRIREQDQIPKSEKSPRDSVDPKQDSLFTAIAKLGGLNRDEVKSEWGITDKIATTVFGKPVLRKSAGRALDEMARALGELGYLSQDRNGKTDVRELEEKFLSENSGDPQYSVLYVVPEDARPSDDMGGGRFGEGELLAMGLPDGDVRLAIERKMVSKAGFHPDFIAELFGFDSGAQLISELADIDAPAYTIEKIVDARMLMNHGDLATDEAIEDAADKAIMNKVRARHVITEHNALAKATGSARILEKAAQELADKIIAAKKVRDIQPKEFTAAAAKAAVSAKKAMRDGNLKQAAEDSRSRVIQTVTARAAFDAKDEIKAIDAFFKKVLAGRSDKLAKTRDMDIVNAARALLSEFGYGRKGQDPQSYLEIMKRQDPVTYDAVIGSVVAARALDVDSIQDLTLDQLRQVHEEVQSLWFLSKRSRQMEIEGDKMDRAEVEDALVARLEEIGPIASEAGKESAITEKEVMALNMGSVKSALTRVENWVSMLDGNNKFGPFRRYFYQPIKDAADKYREAKGNTLKSFRGLFDQIMPDMKKGLIKADELGYTFGKDSGGVAMNEILHAILHTGNKSNKRKMLLGRGWAEELPDGSLDTRRWDAFIARMIREGVIRKEHFDFAQGVWDLLESTKDKAQEAHRNAYGKYFDEVSADEFTTPFGTYRGGYVPAKIDSRIVLDNELRDLVDAGKEGMAYAFPSTTKGFTKARVEYNKPLLLDLRLLSQHIDSVLLFSYMENPIRDAAKVMSRGKVNMALNAQQPGMVSGAIIPFLNRAGRQQVTTPVVGVSWVMRKLNQIRANTGMAAMFANVSNAAQQVSGFALAATKVNPALMVSAAADYLARPTKMPEEVAELSVFMRNRMSNETSAMMGEIEQILLDPNLYEKTQDWFKRHGYFMQSAVDNVMGPIIWKAAFTQYQEQGFSIDDSVRLADSVIRTTQGSTLPEDVSRMETGPAYARLLTQFAGYFNMQANLLGEEFGKVAQNGGLRKNMGRGFYLLIAGFLAPAMVAEAISQAFRGGPGDEDKDGEYLDDWLMATLVYGPLRNATAFVPFVGQAINSAVARFNGNPTDDKVSVAPVVGAIEGVAGVPFDLYREAVDKGNSNRTIKDVATLISLTTGIPVTAAAKPIRYLAGQEEGKIQPVSAADAARGLLTGVASPESRSR